MLLDRGPCSLFPGPCTLCSLDPVACSLDPGPCSLDPAPCTLRSVVSYVLDPWRRIRLPCFVPYTPYPVLYPILLTLFCTLYSLPSYPVRCTPLPPAPIRPTNPPHAATSNPGVYSVFYTTIHPIHTATLCTDRTVICTFACFMTLLPARP